MARHATTAIVNTVDLALIEKQVDCPFCGETVSVVLDLSAGGQSYIEDCQVCCQPMQIAFEVGDNEQLTVWIDRAS